MIVTDDELLDDTTVVEYLHDRGILRKQSTTTVESLPGGVSSVALLVRSAGGAVVVKQALPRLRVAATWRADRGRTLREAAALRAYAKVAPGSVPEVIDVDSDAYALTMEALPARLRPWKLLLLAGEVRPSISALLGHTLGRWHAATAASRITDWGGEQFSDRAVFRQLRVEPYYETIAARHPTLAGPIKRTLGRMLRYRHCLIHGDFSPKNVLTDGQRAVVLDCEVAHIGDHSFDLAFMIHHLALKAIARPDSAALLEACGRQFVRAYHQHPLPWRHVTEAHLVHQTACLMLARVDGKSPVDYLDHPARDVVRQLTADLLSSPSPSLPALWSRIAGT